MMTNLHVDGHDPMEKAKVTKRVKEKRVVDNMRGTMI
jgi:hypothetical protein